MPKRSTAFRGWKVVGAGAVMQGLQSALVMHAMGSYLVELEKEYGWSKTALSGAFAMNRAETALLGPVQGWLLDRFGPRVIARVGAMFMATGFVGFSMLQTLWHFYLAFLCIAVGTSFCGFVTVTVSIVRWFEALRARALSVGGMGLGVGGLCLPLVVLCFTRFGWRATAAVTGVGGAAVAWWLAKYLEGRPADFGQQVDGGASVVAKGKTVRAEGLSDTHFTATEAMRTRAFWMISLGHMSALFVVGVVMAHLQLFLTSERGYSLQQASFVAAALPLVQVAGMALGGYLGDRVNKRLIASVAMCGHAVALLLLAWSGRFWVVALFVVLHGLAWGARGPLMQALRADYFGASSFATIMGISSSIVLIGTVLGPLWAGWMADVTGSYTLAFVVLSAMTAVGMTFFVLARPPVPPQRHSSGAEPAAAATAGTGTADAGTAGTGTAAAAMAGIEPVGSETGDMTTSTPSRTA
ncbi:MFS transporter [Candidatus Poriferisodalis sp.]|uniref:MFS transporter n=1 Tax=Candidatus Poriferisodalis sp. TaxID=3101277 RepID=UPI003B024A36